MPGQNPERWWRALIWVFVGALVSFLVTQFGSSVVNALRGRSPSIAAQLDAVRAKANRQGLVRAVDLPVVLHESASHLFVFRPRVAAYSTASPRSDEIRIYDESNGKIHLRFHFAPTTRNLRFKLYGVGRFDDTALRELLGSYELGFTDVSAPYAISVLWDSSRNRYRIDGLLPPTQPHRMLPATGYFAQEMRVLYATRSLRNRFDHEHVDVNGAQAFALRRRPTPLMLVAYIAKSSDADYRRRYEVFGWSISFASGAPTGYPCTTRPRHILETYDDARHANLFAAWQKVKVATGC